MFPRTLLQLTAAYLIAATAVLRAAPLTIFTNGKIVTVDESFSITETMAVDGASIVAA